MMNRIKDENHYVIMGWMTSKLKLKGLSKDVFAIIYGFSQTESQICTASEEYIAEFVGASERSVRRAIISLLEQGYIIKHKRLGKRNTYRALSKEELFALSDSDDGSASPDKMSAEEDATPDKMSAEKKTTPDKMSADIGQNVRCTPDKMSDNNIDYIINISSSSSCDVEDKIYKLYENISGHMTTPQIASDIQDFLRDGIEAKLICEVLREASRRNVKPNCIWAYVRRTLLMNERKGIISLAKYRDKELLSSQNRAAPPQQSSSTPGIDETRKILAELSAMEG